MLEGFESRLAEEIQTEDDGEIYMKDTKLTQSTRPTRNNQQDFLDLRKNILASIRTILNERFDVDKTFLQKCLPFLNFQRDAEIKTVHEILAPDLSLANLNLQFMDIVNNSELLSTDLKINQKILRLAKTNESRKSFRELITVLARIAACTPHSADVERCISSNNRLKTKLRSSITVETENKYLFIHFNMPALNDWNPTTAASLFIEEKTRRKRDTSTKKGGKPRDQPYFNGVFSGSTVSVDSEDKSPDDVSSKTFFNF